MAGVPHRLPSPSPSLQLTCWVAGTYHPTQNCKQTSEFETCNRNWWVAAPAVLAVLGAWALSAAAAAGTGNCPAALRATVCSAPWPSSTQPLQQAQPCAPGLHPLPRAPAQCPSLPPSPARPRPCRGQWRTEAECCRPGAAHAEGCSKPEPCWTADAYWPERTCGKTDDQAICTRGWGAFASEDECCAAGAAFSDGCGQVAGGEAA